MLLIVANVVHSLKKKVHFFVLCMINLTLCCIIFLLLQMDHAMLADEVDALRKYNYTLEQRLLKFYRKSNEVL